MASSSSSSGRLPLQRALQNLRMECETGGQQRLQSQLNGKSIEELRKLCIAAGVSIRLGDSDVKLSKSDLVLELVRVLSTPAEAWWQMLCSARILSLCYPTALRLARLIDVLKCLAGACMMPVGEVGLRQNTDCRGTHACKFCRRVLYLSLWLELLVPP